MSQSICYTVSKMIKGLQGCQASGRGFCICEETSSKEDMEGFIFSLVYMNLVFTVVTLIFPILALKSSIIVQVNESLFPCKLSSTNTKLAEEAVELAVKTWGKRSLTELEAEERLSYSCEKVKFAEDTDFHL